MAAVSQLSVHLAAAQPVYETAEGLELPIQLIYLLSLLGFLAGGAWLVVRQVRACPTPHGASASPPVSCGLAAGGQLPTAPPPPAPPRLATHACQRLQQVAPRTTGSALPR